MLSMLDTDIPNLHQTEESNYVSCLLTCLIKVILNGVVDQRNAPDTEARHEVNEEGNHGKRRKECGCDCRPLVHIHFNCVRS